RPYRRARKARGERTREGLTVLATPVPGPASPGGRHELATRPGNLTAGQPSKGETLVEYGQGQQRQPPPSRFSIPPHRRIALPLLPPLLSPVVPSRDAQNDIVRPTKARRPRMS